MTVVEIEHFAYGLWTPVLAYTVSCIGALVGLVMAGHVRSRRGWPRAGWLLGAAISIGCTGIWAMHFIAMLGFQVTGMVIRYDIVLTILSGMLAVVVVGVGLTIVALRPRGLGPLLLAGLITGLGVASMHYMGMASMRMYGTMHHLWSYVVAAIVIAIVAATAALWAALHLRSGWFPVLGASLLMGLAVSAMHYTGMMGMRVAETSTTAGPGRVPEGAEAMDFFLPLFVGLILLTLVFALLAILTPTTPVVPVAEERRPSAAAQSIFAPARTNGGSHSPGPRESSPSATASQNSSNASERHRG
ncbi:MHYT domain-containing protein [Salinactinospora qingdaonensis]|uniref:MHYT domain-containing protein n=1 Tax=Salinactinospora qingdaonensis TaxID=702744 RepID=A0ABP7GHR0_9ACTN